MSKKNSLKKRPIAVECLNYSVENGVEPEAFIEALQQSPSQ